MYLTCRAVPRNMHLNTIIGIPSGWIYSMLGSVVRTPYSLVTVFGDQSSIVCVSVMFPTERVAVI